MKLPVVNHQDYVAKINDDNKFPIRKFGELANYLINQKNDLQSIVEKQHPVIKKVINSLSKAKGCYFSRMTGSGSVCYGLFTDKKCAKVAFKNLRKKYPKFWLSFTKTI